MTPLISYKCSRDCQPDVAIGKQKPQETRGPLAADKRRSVLPNLIRHLSSVHYRKVGLEQVNVIETLITTLVLHQHHKQEER